MSVGLNIRHSFTLTIRGCLITPFILGGGGGVHVCWSEHSSFVYGFMCLRIYEFGLWLGYHDYNYLLSNLILEQIHQRFSSITPPLIPKSLTQLPQSFFRGSSEVLQSVHKTLPEIH